MAEHRTGLHRYFTPATINVRLPARRDAAYTSLAFNVGPAGAAKSTATRRLNAGHAGRVILLNPGADQRISLFPLGNIVKPEVAKILRPASVSSKSPTEASDQSEGAAAFIRSPGRCGG
ncbi:MAG: hypothetical protein EOR86_04125 [Mesorhizobium sp.]|uniref:glycoside hydrolase family protein n=1 Tax=Mesorhizobium sp. TaxID=1871066 RepID=UPI000FE74917|nr:hypothetical protein [Mesorhizobium sp.]RWN01047.1 MAG: hypothetical protein EOR86_04125 [Mesorhizobium sp.]